MEENNNNFKSISTKTYTGSFTKTVLVPFLSGIIGASLVLGLCFGVPKIREEVIETLNIKNKNNTSSVNPDDNQLENLNTQLVSLQGYSDTATGVAAKVLPSIVGIEIEYNVKSFFGTGKSKATGSGIIISEDGYILTNNHVVSASSSSSYYEISDAVSVKVTLYNDDTVYDAEIVGKDDETDLAVIKINKTGLTAAEFANSDNVMIGEFAMAVGCPLGLSTTVTTGIVSAVNREITTEDGEKYVVIQTDAAINAGNSGGALVNSQGKVIGVNTLKLSGEGVEGIGFAIPINSTLDVTSELIDHNKVLRPYMGISCETVTEEDAKSYNLVTGVYVDSIERFSAAQKAGLKAGDVITEIDGKQVTTSQELTEIINTHNIGDKIKLKIYRDKSYQEIELTLGEKP